MIAVTVTSAWSWSKMKKFSLFFWHWLSGLVMSVGLMIDDLLVSICWARSSVEGLIRTLKFIEQSAANLLAITNLAICINLALIISSYRTNTRVASVSSPRVILMSLVMSMGVAAASIPLTDDLLVLATGFWLTNADEETRDIIVVLASAVEFFVGVVMLCVMVWLIIQYRKEVKACWKLHRRIRYYVGLTIIGTAVNLALGICGMIFVLGDPAKILLTSSWLFRFVHIALDAIVLHDVLRERRLDERGDDGRPGVSGHGTGTRTGFRRSNYTGKPVIVPLSI